MEKQTHPERQYLNLMQEILDKGVKQTDKGTGVVTYSLFGRQMRFNLSEGFPLLTTKKVYWKGVLQELYWFLSGQSNIKYLVDNNVHIWDDYPYKIYRELSEKKEVPEMTKEKFIEKIAKDYIKGDFFVSFTFGCDWYILISRILARLIELILAPSKGDFSQWRRKTGFASHWTYQLSLRQLS